MLKNSFAFLLLAILTLYSCQSPDGPTSPNKGKTPTGYDYELIVSNEGRKPKVGDEVRYHQKIFISDSILMSTYLSMSPMRVIIPPLEEVAKPVRPDYEALFFMSAGDSLVTYQKLDTFSKEILPKGTKNSDVYRYEIKLLSIKDKTDVDKSLAAMRARDVPVSDSLYQLLNAYKNKQLGDVLQKSESGLEYIIHEEGTGKKAEPGRFVTMHYSGCFQAEENCFASTFRDAKPYTARIGRRRVIKAWDEGIPMLSEGGKATFFVPYELAYGLAGNPPQIPEKADLVFYVEVLKVY